jgi:hypothetical protein
MLLGPLEVDPGADAATGAAGGPVAAVLDGPSVQAYSLPSNRLVLDDPDNLQGRAMVSRRVHGASVLRALKPGGSAPCGRSWRCRRLAEQSPRSDY